MSGRHDRKRLKQLERLFEVRAGRDRRKRWQSLEAVLPDAGDPPAEPREDGDLPSLPVLPGGQRNPRSLTSNTSRQ